MKTINLSKYVMPGILLGTLPLPMLAKQKPNVIIVITDDQGKGDLGCLGNPKVKTPNIDQFYEDAVRLHNFHVSPTSGPTRSAIMTGRFSNRTNVFHTVGGRDRAFEDEYMMPKVFSDNGYKTAMYGKWHLGDNYPFRPEDKGFQEVLRHGGGGVGQTPDYWGNDYFDDTYWHNGVAKDYKGYCTDVFFDEALKFIEKNHDKPFFTYIALNAPHGPYNVEEEYYNLYKDSDIPHYVKRFYGMISNIDDNFKRLEDKLTELNIADNTILIFMTDNGTAGGQAVSLGGMRGSKNSEYDGGHCVPFFIRWKDGKLSGGKDINQLTAHIDMLPTLVDLCNLKAKPTNDWDGISVKSFLRNPEKKDDKRIIVTDSQRLQNLTKWRKSAVMTNDWRLVNGKELYEIKKDKAQEHDVAKEYPQVVEDLRKAYEQWWTSLDSDKINQRFTYAWVGDEHENPARLSVHELHSGFLGESWNQNGIMKAEPIKGIFKVRFLEDAKYRITLCRYPLESGFAINQNVPAVDPTFGVEAPRPASCGTKMKEAHLYLADLEGKQSIKPVQETDQGISYELFMYEGKYDMEAYFLDEMNRIFPSCYIYIEKL